ncbi:hypothetical protein PR048_004641 [Dryococelus australis]|uniref:Uncharacterized protein n=1 Tax=Dryococelus australis TaxID=614101 RepID=A0ABQ9I603_9NEOP|nr:hypothetical protein PR048_004641 [Dryococelus australis]
MRRWPRISSNFGPIWNLRTCYLVLKYFAYTGAHMLCRSPAHDVTDSCMVARFGGRDVVGRDRYDGNTAHFSRRSDEALGLCVSVARIAPSLLDLGRGVPTGKKNFGRFGNPWLGRQLDTGTPLLGFHFYSRRHRKGFFTGQNAHIYWRGDGRQCRGVEVFPGSFIFSPPARLPPRRSRFDPGRVTPDFRMWEVCRTMPLVGGFSRGSLVSPALSFRRCSILTSITLIGSKVLDVKSRSDLSTQILPQSILELYEEEVDNSREQRNADVAIELSSHATLRDETKTKQHRHNQRKRKNH